MATKLLTRPVEERVLTGVCAGVAHYLDTDPIAIRAGAVTALFVTGFIPVILLYLALSLVIPTDVEVNGGEPHGDDVKRDLSALEAA